MQRLKLNRGKSPESTLATLATLTMIFLFDPGDDGEAQLFLRFPASSVEDVLLQECVERLDGRVVGRGGDSSHRADESIVLQHHHEFPGSKLRSAVGMHLRAGGVTQRDGVRESRDGQVRRHPITD